ncbi:type II secretion system protein [Sulfurimonas sp. HSL3-7]|uniref:type IV pilus modification PilV family protein n=1 Tax=Sulfonitrofixus jiaomeiensis TaxID=3131938 RepID=UPI0031F8ECEF
MKRYASVCLMPKMSRGFTLLEVLVAVMIIAVVIGSLIELFANNSYTFKSVRQKILHTNTTSVLLGNEIYGYEKAKTDLAELVKDFNIDDDLRRQLKNVKVEIIYNEVTSIDFGEAAESIADIGSGENGDDTLIQEASEAVTALEVGRTTMKVNDQSSSFLRVKLQ